MPLKRRYSTRVTRETPKKKRQSKQASPDREPSSAQETSKQKSPTAPPPDPHLPTKISDDLALPILEHHQHVTNDLLQSVNDSGVLAASLQRSRVKWLGEGLFQRYWTKPTKKKGQVVEPPNNPTKDTMHKIGTCRIMIEPHIFEAILYSIRDPHTSTPEVAANTPVKHMPQHSHTSVHYSYPSTPVASHDGSVQAYQYTSATTHASPHTISQSPYQQATSTQNTPSTHVWQSSTPNNLYVSSPVPSPAPQASPSIVQSPSISNYASQLPPSKSAIESTQTNISQMTQFTDQSASQHSSNQTSQHVPLASFQTSVQTSTTHLTPPPNQQTTETQAQSSPAPPRPSHDPVIQMLAQRASTSPELKVLMKIVAAGDASTDQLKIFQSHIDELTAILHSRRQAGEAAFPVSAPLNAATSLAPAVGPVSAQQVSKPVISTSVHPPTGPYQIQHPSPLGPRPPVNVLSAKVLPYYTATPPLHMKPKQFVPPKPEITGVAIEFVAGSGDRFLFPRNCILEFIPQLRQVMASFLIVRKGGEAPKTTANIASEPEKYQTDNLYHQPVTIRIATDHPRVMELISRAVATYDEARKHMEETIATTTRAEDVHLAIRLPIEEAVLGEKDDRIAQEEANTAQGPPPEKEKKQRAKQQRTAGMPKVDPFKNNCLFCFSPLLGSTALQNGERSCAGCASLFTKKSTNPSATSHNSGRASGIGLAMRQSKTKCSGPRTLSLPVA